MQGYSFKDLNDFLQATYVDENGSPYALQVQPYSYPVRFANVAQNVTAPGSLPINSDGDFICLGLSHQAFSIATALTEATAIQTQARLMIVDTGSQQRWFDSDAALEVVSANAATELRTFPVPRIVKGRSSLQVSLTNLANAALTCDLLFLGFMVRRFTG